MTKEQWNQYKTVNFKIYTFGDNGADGRGLTNATKRGVDEPLRTCAPVFANIERKKMKFNKTQNLFYFLKNVTLVSRTPVIILKIFSIKIVCKKLKISEEHKWLFLKYPWPQNSSFSLSKQTPVVLIAI